MEMDINPSRGACRIHNFVMSFDRDGVENQESKERDRTGAAKVIIIRTIHGVMTVRRVRIGLIMTISLCLEECLDIEVHSRDD